MPLKLKRGFGRSEIALSKSLQIVMGRKLMYVNVILFKAASSLCLIFFFFIRAPSGKELNVNLQNSGNKSRPLLRSLSDPPDPLIYSSPRTERLLIPSFTEQWSLLSLKWVGGVVGHAQWVRGSRWLRSTKWFLMCCRHFRSRKIRGYFKG